MAAQKRRATKKVAARVEEQAPSANITSKMGKRQRAKAIKFAMGRWEDFLKLPIKTLTLLELQGIIDAELARTPPRWAVIKRAHSAYGVIRNHRSVRC